jgi:hypothetical protein
MVRAHESGARRGTAGEIGDSNALGIDLARLLTFRGPRHTVAAVNGPSPHVADD